MSRKIVAAAAFAAIAFATSFASTTAMADGLGANSGTAGWHVQLASPTTNDGPGTQPADVQKLRASQAEAACAVFKSEPGRQANCLSTEAAEAHRLTPVPGSGG